MPQEFQTAPMLPGLEGLDLKRALDRIKPTKLARMTNVVRNQEGELSCIEWETTEIDTSGFGPDWLLHHSIGRLDDPLTGNFLRVLGISQYLAAASPALGIVTLFNGMSGDPLSLVTYRPPLSGQAWMFVGDRLHNFKVRSTDALTLPIGISAPAGLSGNPTLAAVQSTLIYDAEAAGWTNNNGTGAGAPANALDFVNYRAGASSVQFTTNVAADAYQFWNKAKAVDLSVVGALPASDDDMIHLWLRMDRPDLITEIRFYLVCSPVFDLATLPGQDVALNTDAFVHAFRASDFSAAFAATSTVTTAASTANSNDQALQQANVQVNQALIGRGTWTEMGVVGLTLRRGDFTRIGSNAAVGWANITGMVMYVSSKTAVNVNVWLDDVYLYGGSGPDDALSGTDPYDYRVTNYDPRTGAESNPSPVLPETAFIDSVRTGIIVAPQNYPLDVAILQRFYRRGGTLTNNWYFVGVNTSNGAAIQDDLSDSQIATAGTLSIENDQPVTTVDALGNEILAQPLPALWGPVNDMIFGCGDPYRPGNLYWCLPGFPDAWPAVNNVEVCSPSEELMAGCTWGGQSYVFSRKRMFNIYPNLTAAGSVTALPSPCGHGLINRWAIATGYGGIFFVGQDGVYSTQGGPELCISDADLHAIFHGEARNGYQPIDLNQPNSIRLAVFDDDLWLTYRDIQGNYNQMIYSLLYNYWRAFSFGRQVANVYAEPFPPTTMPGTPQPGSSLLLGGIVGKTYKYYGTSDDGLAISADARTGALDQGAPRQDKLYGDVILDADRGGVTLTVTPYLNAETSSLAPYTITTGAARTRYINDPFGTGPQLARNLSLDISWSTTAAPPIIYLIGPSYIVQPDNTVGRYTDWDFGGRATDKWVKGIIIEADTFGAAKTVELQADGVTQTTITLNATGRQILQFSFAEFRGRLLRLHPTGANEYINYRTQWIFDEEPLSLSRWETQELTFRIPGHAIPLAAYPCLRSSGPVSLAITVTRQDGTGSTFSLAPTPIPSTGGLKQKPYVPLPAGKGVLFKFLFTADAQFWLYREESEMLVMPWGGDQPVAVKPFGSDDLDLVRAMQDAAATASRPGGGERGA